MGKGTKSFPTHTDTHRKDFRKQFHHVRKQQDDARKSTCYSRSLQAKLLRKLFSQSTKGLPQEFHLLHEQQDSLNANQRLCPASQTKVLRTAAPFCSVSSGHQRFVRASDVLRERRGQDGSEEVTTLSLVPALRRGALVHSLGRTLFGERCSTRRSWL